MLRLKNSWLSIVAFAFDMSAVVCAWAFAYLERFNADIPADFRASAFIALLWILPIHAVFFRTFGLYRGMWVFASMPDLIRITKAVAVALVATMICTVMFQPIPAIPRSVLLLHPFFLLLIMGGARALYRAGKEYHNFGGLVAQGQPVIVLGAGMAGNNLIRELARSPDWRLVGILDDDAKKHGRELHGIRVLGYTGELPRWASELKAHHAIIALPSASADAHRRIANTCVRAGVKAMTLPALTNVDAGRPFLSRVRRVDLEDLLGRDAVKIDGPHVEALLKDRVIMVTGAGGSIGAELCRQIAKFSPAQIIALDISEFALYRLTEEFHEKFRSISLLALAGDVKDSTLLRHILGRYSPAVLFHAAAYKHVPMMEDLNSWQAVRNNVLGTYRVAKAALEYGVPRFVLISTDKAVNPTNVMGASKRLAEMVCQSLQQSSTSTSFETVRFGNVLGSAGSVIPKFQEQIARGGPVTVTHPEITRFFMTIPEATQLVLQASAMGRGGEIFVLDMGKPVKIVELARDLIQLYGLSDSQIKIIYTGLRPGEKLYEELLSDEETTVPTHHTKLRIARAREVEPETIEAVMQWLTQPRIVDDEEVRRDLRRFVPEYRPAQRPALHAVHSSPGAQTS